MSVSVLHRSELMRSRNLNGCKGTEIFVNLRITERIIIKLYVHFLTFITRERLKTGEKNNLLR